jgi:hypothetical protein
MKRAKQQPAQFLLQLTYTSPSLLLRSPFYLHYIGVACQYPKGLYVGLIYIAALFLILVIYILSRPTRGLFTLGRHYILQTYLIGMVVAAVAIVVYLAVHHFEFLTSNDKSHLASTTRP